ncbi:PH domain-containing protein [Halomonas eurihalina]|uniref:PH domain-containing protein n=1 Tax=Halomonas eurihalina TaxID=42566 RepID=A0A5D9DCQ2_HALER|nr:PH domain-containing protein [Halomonas eurihalina]MDR5858220.1 PH domain-containing protein [Halomonas eurihalina]TZG41283.1 PH domain-containing protein [Halomonas eurihalina]
MAYVDSTLMSGEKVEHRARLHWIILVVPLTWLVVAYYLFTLDVSEESSTILAMLGTFAMLVFIVKEISAIITYFTTELAVTSRRVIAKKGLIRRKTAELNHSKVEGMNVDQSVLGRLLNYGTLNVNGTGAGRTPVSGVKAPLDFRRRALELIDA